MFHAAKPVDQIFACTPHIRSPTIFGNPPADESDDVISLRVKSIGLFAHSLRPAGIRTPWGGPPLPDALSSRNRGNEVRIMIDLSERRSNYVWLRNYLTWKMETLPSLEID